MTWVAVISLNDYPHSVSKSYSTCEEAYLFGAAECLRLQKIPTDEIYGAMLYYHFHVFEQPT